MGRITCICGAEIQEGQAFCTVCGRPVEKRFVQEATPTFCTSCGAPLAQDAAFCTSCGARIDTANMPNAAQGTYATAPTEPLRIDNDPNYGANNYGAPYGNEPTYSTNKVYDDAPTYFVDDAAYPTNNPQPGNSNKITIAVVIAAVVVVIVAAVLVAVFVFGVGGLNSGAGNTSGNQTNESSTANATNTNSTHSNTNTNTNTNTNKNTNTNANKNTNTNSSGSSASSSNTGSSTSSTSTKTVTVKTKSGDTLTGTVRVKSGGYVIPDSSTHTYTESEIDALGLNAAELSIARNEIYAREGYDFSNSGLQSYFDSCSWYHNSGSKPTLSAGSAADKNAQLLLDISKETSDGSAWLDLATN